MIKKITIAILLSLIIAVGLKFILFSTEENDDNQLSFDNLNNGDLVLRKGRSTESFAVYMTDDNAEFSHIGIISIENNKPFVIHAVPHKDKTLKKETLAYFLDKENSSKYAIYRSNFNSEILNNVVKHANTFYNNKYIFDNEFNLKTDTKLYCTELILKAFNNSGIELNVKPKNLNFVIGSHQIIFPSEFTKKPIFNKVNFN